MVFLLSGTFCCLKSSLSILLADRMNIANMISNDLIKTMMSSIRKDVYLPTQDDLRDGRVTVEEFFQASRSYWKGAVMDIMKTYNEGKPVLFEGVLSFEDVVETPFKPSNQRWEVAKQFIEGPEPTDLQQLFDALNPKKTDASAASFSDMSWLAVNASDAEANIMLEFRKAKAVPAVVIPIILMISKKDHRHLIREKVHKELSWQESADKSKERIDLLVEETLCIAQAVQEKLIKTSPGIIVPLPLSHYDHNCEIIQQISLEQIREQFLPHLEASKK